MVSSKPEGVKVKFRRMKFDFEETGFDRYWQRDSPFISLFWGAVSAAFPGGESFFIDSCRNVKDQIEDPELRSEIDQFSQQEAHHTFQHRKFNKMVGEQGYDMERNEARFNDAIDFMRERLDDKGMLAMTMALEHFTAGFAVQYLTNPRISKGADPNVSALWAWHAAEEAEHKATAFDVYNALGGGYWQRVRMIPTLWLAFVGITLTNLFFMLKRDGKLWNIVDITRGLWFLLGWRGFISSMIPSFLAYFKPGFYPWSSPKEAQLIDDWQGVNSKYIDNLEAVIAAA